MKINFVNKPAHSSSRPLDNHGYMEGCIGVWAVVEEVDSTANRVDVCDCFGHMVYGLPVVSNEWVCKTDDYVSGSRNLPKKGSRVFVLMPNHTMAGAFVLCSGYAAGETGTHTLFASSSDKKTKNNIYERVTQSGWNIKEEYENGKLSVISQDEKTKIEIDPGSAESVKVTCGNYVMEMSKSGLTVKNGSASSLEVT